MKTGFDAWETLFNERNPPTFGWTPDCKWPVVYGATRSSQSKIICTSDKVSGLHLPTKNFIQTISGEELGIAYEDSDFDDATERRS